VLVERRALELHVVLDRRHAAMAPVAGVAVPVRDLGEEGAPAVLPVAGRARGLGQRGARRHVRPRAVAREAAAVGHGRERLGVAAAARGGERRVGGGHAAAHVDRLPRERERGDDPERRRRGEPGAEEETGLAQRVAMPVVDRVDPLREFLRALRFFHP
jgi:hypothetical protein